MTDDQELRRWKIGRRLEWLQEAGVALPQDLADIVRTGIEERQSLQAGAHVSPSLEDQVDASDDPARVAELLATAASNRSEAWFIFSDLGDVVNSWLENHPEKAIPLLRALLERQEGGERAASRVLPWVSDRGDHSQALSCLSMLVGFAQNDLDEYLLSSAARALRALAESEANIEGPYDFWSIWSFLVEAASRSSEAVQPHEHNPLTDSLNAVGGYLAEAFIFRLHQERVDGGSVSNLRERLKALAAGSRDFHFLARTMLASRLPWLHAIDPEWTKDVLIARMSWSGSKPTAEARALWQGYLWAPRLTPKLLDDLKPAFLQALKSDLDVRGDNNLFHLFADLLIAAPDKLSADEIRSAFREMPVDGLIVCARYWQQLLKGAPSSAATIWTEKLGPLIRDYWPVVNAKVTPKTVQALAFLALHTREAFPEAFKILLEKGLLDSIAKSGFILSTLSKGTSAEDDAGYYDYAMNHPNEILKLIDRSIDFEGVPYERDQLRDILNRAQGSGASVKQTQEYHRLHQRTMQ